MITPDLSPYGITISCFSSLISKPNCVSSSNINFLASNLSNPWNLFGAFSFIFANSSKIFVHCTHAQMNRHSFQKTLVRRAHRYILNQVWRHPGLPQPLQEVVPRTVTTRRDDTYLVLRSVDSNLQPVIREGFTHHLSM